MVRRADCDDMNIGIWEPGRPLEQRQDEVVKTRWPMWLIATRVSTPSGVSSNGIVGTLVASLTVALSV